MPSNSQSNSLVFSVESYGRIENVRRVLCLNFKYNLSTALLLSVSKRKTPIIKNGLLEKSQISHRLEIGGI